MGGLLRLAQKLGEGPDRYLFQHKECERVTAAATSTGLGPREGQDENVQWYQTTEVLVIVAVRTRLPGLKVSGRAVSSVISLQQATGTPGRQLSRGSKGGKGEGGFEDE